MIMGVWKIQSTFKKWRVRRKVIKYGNILKLNVGCGEQIFEDHLNLDVRRLDKEAIYHDISNLSFLPDKCVSMISAFDIVEHISQQKADDMMAEWARVMFSGAKLCIKVPDLKTQAELYLNGPWSADKFSRQILGVYDYDNDALGHKVAYDSDSLTRLLNRHGLLRKDVQKIKTPTTFNLIVWAVKV